MKLVVQKNNLGGQIWHRILDPVKKTASKLPVKIAKISSLFEFVEELERIESLEFSSKSSFDGIRVFLGESSFFDFLFGVFFAFRTGVELSEEIFRSGRIIVSLNIGSPQEFTYLFSNVFKLRFKKKRKKFEKGLFFEKVRKIE